MNDTGTAPEAPRIPKELVDEYERLRGAVTGARRLTDLHGLGIFVGRGMAAWMRACAAVPAAVTPPYSETLNAGVPMLPRAQLDVVDVLTAMVMTLSPEVMTR